MNSNPSEAPLFSFRSIFSTSPSTNMSQLHDQMKQLPLPTHSKSSSSLPPTPDYDRGFRKFHHHTISDSTVGSNDSSPTTTISTVDDSSATETSPGSSPESPPPATFEVGMLRPRTADDTNTSFELQKQPPPSRKGRNLKNLAVNTSRTPGKGALTAGLPLPPQNDPAASVLSPGFVKPPTPQRRKPGKLGLTILTPAGNQVAVAPQEVKLSIPPTPAFGRPATLRHFQSSPSLPLVPGIGLPLRPAPLNLQRHQTLETIFSPISAVTRPSQLEEEEQNFDVPLSQEEKPEAYPDGPICIYDNIDLFLEPTAEQARQYDVIMNVASEVRNPFIHQNEPAPSEPDLRIDGGGGIQYAPKRLQVPLIPESAATKDSASSQEVSPTTPKATPLNSAFPKEGPLGKSPKQPEYIHIPWDHNSDIVPDLFRLVKLVDEKAMRGKKVLIHCQCGVSRSASLVVAYGLYKNPGMSVQEAYDAVKRKSKWIGPNMNLIMQLQEFRSSLARGGVLNRGASPNTPSSALSEWGGPFSMRNPTPLSAVMASSQDTKPTDLFAAITGPSSAPSGYPWPTKDPGMGSARPPSTYVDPAGHVVPALQIVNADSGLSRQYAAMPDDANSTTPTESPASPRSAEFAMTPIVPSLEEADPADAFGILSPTSTEYASSPWDRSALLASLGMGSVRQQDDTHTLPPPPPRRSTSLKSRPGLTSSTSPQSKPTLGAPPRRLRGKISSPTLREQHQLQNLQAQIVANLPLRNTTSTASNSLGIVDEALLSPRATEFTANPFALAAPSATGSSSPGVGTAKGGDDTARISTQTIEMPPRSLQVDPRSPAHKGASPITRSIFDFL